MRITLTSLLTLLLLGCSSPGPVPALKTEDATAELRPIVDKIYQAWTSLDLSKPGVFYARDSDLMFFDVAPLKYTGLADYLKGFGETIKDWKSIRVAIQPDFKGWKQGNVAWAVATGEFELELKEGPKQKMTMRMTELFEKRDGQWLVVHEHVSAPLVEPPKPDAGKKK